MAQLPIVQLFWVDCLLGWCPPVKFDLSQGPSPLLLSVVVVPLGIVSALAIGLVQSWAGKAWSCVT